MHQGSEQQMPSFNLPSKILCKVVNVHLRVSFGISMYACCLLFFSLLIFYTEKCQCITSISNGLNIWFAQAEPETDEVYAQITLLPDPDVSTLPHVSFDLSIFSSVPRLFPAFCFLFLPFFNACLIFPSVVDSAK